MTVIRVEWKYGIHEVNCVSIVGDRVVAPVEDIRIQKGTKTSEGVLKEDLIIAPGPVLVTTHRHAPNRREIFTHGIMDALSGLERAVERAEVLEVHDLLVGRRVVYAALEELTLYKSLTKDELQAVKMTMMKVRQYLVRAENEHKVRAADQLVNAMTLKDSKGRSNPGATSARLVVVNEELLVRLDEVSRIYPKLSSRIIGMRTKVEDIHAIFDAINTWSGHWMLRLRGRDPLSRDQKKQIWAGMSRARGWLGEVYVAPYLNTAEHLRETMNIDNEMIQSISDEELVGVMATALRITTAQQRRRLLLENNIVLGKIQQRRLPAKDFSAQLKDLKKKTVDLMFDAAKAVPRDHYPLARARIDLVKDRFKQASESPTKTWLKDVRDACKDVAEMMV